MVFIIDTLVLLGISIGLDGVLDISARRCKVSAETKRIRLERCNYLSCNIIMSFFEYTLHLKFHPFSTYPSRQFLSML
jgi:hypothetical protein